MDGVTALLARILNVSVPLDPTPHPSWGGACDDRILLSHSLVVQEGAVRVLLRQSPAISSAEGNVLLHRQV